MKTIKRLAAYLLCLCLAVLPACGGFLSPQQRGDAHQLVDDALARREVTPKQADAMHEAIDSDEPIVFGSLGLLGLNLAMALIGGPMIVRSGMPLLGRGAPTQRVGLPASKIRTAV